MHHNVVFLMTFKIKHSVLNSSKRSYFEFLRQTDKKYTLHILRMLFFSACFVHYAFLSAHFFKRTLFNFKIRIMSLIFCAEIQTLRFAQNRVWDLFFVISKHYDKGLNVDLFSSLTLENSVSIRFQVRGISLLHTDYVISFFKTLTDCLHTNNTVLPTN